MPDWAPLEEYLKPLGVGQAEAAQKLGVASRPRVLRPRGLRHLRFLGPVERKAKRQDRGRSTHRQP
jgi:hypothetical protein